MRLRHFVRQSPHLAVFSALVILEAILLGMLMFFTGFFAGFIAIWAIPPLGLAWIGIFLFHLFKGNRRPDQRPAALVLLSTPFVFFVVCWITINACLWGTFAIHYRDYQHVIAQADQGQWPPLGTTASQIADNGIEFQAERQGSNRIAFHLPGGFLNEWQGILYDPDGIGQHPPRRQKDGKFEDRLNGWYTIEGCTHMIGRFYSCSFS